MTAKRRAMAEAFGGEANLRWVAKWLRLSSWPMMVEERWGPKGRGRTRRIWPQMLRTERPLTRKQFRALVDGGYVVWFFAARGCKVYTPAKWTMTYIKRYVPEAMV